MDRVWRYCRYEDYETAAEAFDDLHKSLNAYIAGNNLTLVDMTDAVEEGRSIVRGSLNEMMQEAKAGSFDVLLVDSFSQICTNSRLVIQYCDQISHYGVRVISLQEQIEIARGKASA